MQAVDVMTSDVLTAGRERLTTNIAALMMKRGVNAVPLIDDQRKVVGVVSRANLLRALATFRAAAQAMRWARCSRSAASAYRRHALLNAARKMSCA